MSRADSKLLIGLIMCALGYLSGIYYDNQSDLGAYVLFSICGVWIGWAIIITAEQWLKGERKK